MRGVAAAGWWWPFSEDDGDWPFAFDISSSLAPLPPKGSPGFLVVEEEVEPEWGFPVVPFVNELLEGDFSSPGVELVSEEISMVS